MVNELFAYSLIIKTPDKNNLSMMQQENYSSAELTSWLGKPIQVGLQLDGKSIELNEVVDTIRHFWREHIPYEYTSVYERENSYFMDAKGEPLIYFGGLTTASNDWGSASQNTVLSATNPLPAGLKYAGSLLKKISFGRVNIGLIESSLPNFMRPNLGM